MAEFIHCSELSGDIADFGSERPAKYDSCAALPLRQHWLGPEGRPCESAVAYVGREASALCFYVSMVDSQIYTEARQDNDRMWALGDTVEFFMKPGTERRDYWEVHLAPNDLIMDLHIPDRARFTAGEVTWDEVIAASSESSRRVERTDDGWAVELMVPWTAFGLEAAPAAGAVWQFAVCRYNYPGKLEDPEHSSTAPLTEPGFHRYEEYADLIF